MKRSALVIIPLAAMLLFGCAGTGYWGSGHVVSETREVSGFTKVSVMTSGDLSIEVGDETSLTIEADDNLLQYLTSNVFGETLNLGVEEFTSLRSVTHISYHLVVPSLESIQVLGSGDVVSEALETDLMKVSLLGSGDVELDGLTAKELDLNLNGSGGLTIHDGVVEYLDINILGSGGYKGDGVETERADVRILGSGSVKVWVTDSIDATIMGSGDILYYGDPHVDVNAMGSGDAVHMGDR